MWDPMIVFLWCGVLVPSLYAYPTGAPKSACQSMTPRHPPEIKPQSSSSPYVVFVDAVNTPHGSYVRGVISGTNPFHAFMVQARIDGSEQVVGKFIRFDEDTTRTLTCSQHDDTITHTNANSKRQITFVWHVNDVNIPESRIHFVATVAKSFSEFWTNVTSEAITIGSPIREMTTATPVISSHSVPEGRWGPGNPAKPPLNMQGNQKNYQQRRQQWQQPPVGRPFLESEELQLPPAIDAPIPQQPIPLNDSWRHQHFGPGQLLAPTRQIEPKTTSTQNPLISHLNMSLVQEAPNLSAETTGSRPSQERWNQPATAQSRGQHVTEIPRSLKQATPGNVDATRISANSLGATNNFKLSLPAVIFSLIVFLK